MFIYVCLFIILSFNYIAFRNKRKTFLKCSFFMLFLVAALRKYTVGIDLNGHYAYNFCMYARMNWSDAIHAALYDHSFYDPGFIILMKTLSIISDNVQWFIIATSAIIYGSVGRYIYKFSKDPFLETFMFVTSFSYFMYMNIIAQALAISIILFGIDYLYKKEYLRFSIIVLIASFIHSSAIVCLVFILFDVLKETKKNVIRMTVLSVIFVLGIERILPIIIKYILPQFSFYFTKTDSGMMDNVRLLHLILYLFCFFFGILCIYFLPSNKKSNNQHNLCLVNKRKINLQILNNNFLIYSSISSIIFRFLVTNAYIISRMGFYFYLFAYSLATNSVSDIKSSRLRFELKLVIYGFMFLFFIVLIQSLESSYGVLPYHFFWQ